MRQARVRFDSRREAYRVDELTRPWYLFGYTSWKCCQCSDYRSGASDRLFRELEDAIQFAKKCCTDFIITSPINNKL